MFGFDGRGKYPGMERWSRPVSLEAAVEPFIAAFWIYLKSPRLSRTVAAGWNLLPQ
jgi:hypothetical protein